MIDSTVETARCAICAQAVGEGRCYCRFYQSDGVFAFCGAECAEIFLRGSLHRSNGRPGGDLIQEMVEELRWTRFS